MRGSRDGGCPARARMSRADDALLRREAIPARAPPAVRSQPGRVPAAARGARGSGPAAARGPGNARASGRGAEEPRPRPAPGRAVLAVRDARRPGRLRAVDPGHAPGPAVRPRAPAGDARALARRLPPGDRSRRSHRSARRVSTPFRMGPAVSQRGAPRPVRAELLDRPDPDRALLGQASPAAGVRPREPLAPDPAEHHARDLLRGAGGAPDALGHARGPATGLRPHRVGQGPPRPARHLPARAQERA